MEDRTCDFRMILLRMRTRHHRIIDRTPNMHFVGLWSDFRKICHIESETCHCFIDESFIIQNRSNEMKLREMLGESIFSQIFRDEDSSERMSDDNSFLFIQIWKYLLEPDFPSWIRSIFSARHLWTERFKSIRKPFGEPLFPTRVFFIRIIFCITEILEIYLFILESFSSSDEEYLGFLWSHILRDKEILSP